MYGLTLLSSTGVEPVTVAEAREHCEIFGGQHDTMLGSLVTAAREHVEIETGRTLQASAQYRLVLDSFPLGPIQFPVPPLLSVQQIQYTDTLGALQTVTDLSPYDVSTDHMPGRLAPLDGCWPVAKIQPSAVKIDFTAGDASVPQGIKQAILLMVGHWFEHREAVTAGTIAREVPRTAQRLIVNFMIGDEWVRVAT